MKFQFPKLVIPEFLKLKNSSDAVINPATEEKQDAIRVRGSGFFFYH